MRKFSLSSVLLITERNGIPRRSHPVHAASLDIGHCHLDVPSSGMSSPSLHLSLIVSDTHCRHGQRDSRNTHSSCRSQSGPSHSSIPEVSLPCLFNHALTLPVWWARVGFASQGYVCYYKSQPLGSVDGKDLVQFIPR
jgi:hypothetical protein